MTIVGLLLAFGAAFTTGIASVLQALAAQKTSEPEHVGRLFVSPLYLAGIALDTVGFACMVTALHWLPLFLVQCAATTSVGVTAIFGHFWLRTRLLRWQLYTLIGLGAGLALMAAGARAHTAQQLARNDQWWLVAAAVAVGFLGLAISRSGKQRAGGLVAAAAGLAFAGTGVASRVLSDAGSVHAVITAPASYALVIYGIVGMVLFATSLQKTAVTTATAALFGIETLTASAVGLLVLGDATRRGWVAPTAVGFVVTLVCALALALTSDTGHADDASTS